MTWTILILVAAVALYVFAGKLVKTEGKGKSEAAFLAKRGISIVAIVLVAVGINRLGIGTLHYIKTGLNADMQAEQEREQRANSRKVAGYVEDHAEEMVRWAPVLGNESASKTIYVWSDASCPYCRRVHMEFKRVLEENKDVRVVVKNFPVHGEMTDVPARWVIAAKLQSNAKSAVLYDKIMENQYWGEDHNAKDVMKTVNKNLAKYAKDAGLDVEKIQKDIKGGEVASEMAQVREVAGQFGINGTPYVIVNGKAFPGAIPYAQIVDALR